LNSILSRSIYCCGYRYSDVSSEIIFYKQPNPTRLQYISLEPLVLDIQQNGGHKADQDSLTMKNMKKIINTRLHSGKQRTQINDMKLILNQVRNEVFHQNCIFYFKFFFFWYR
jgi:hypothetical protein